MSGVEVGSAYLSILPSAKGFGSNLSRELDGPFDEAGRRGGDRMSEGVGKSKGFVAAGAKTAGLFLAAFAAVGLGEAARAVKDYFVEAVSSASDLNETVNKSNTIFGQNAGAVDKWAKGAAENLGLSRAAALEAAAGFGNMFQQLGFAGDVAAAMSTDVVQLSADLGSFNNLPTADVSERISAALRGEYDSLQLLIPNINAARVEQEALTETGKTSTAELTAGEKAAAVLAIVHRDGAAATGDFAKTSDQLANAQKIANATFEDAKAQIGTAFLPVVRDLFNTFSEVGLPILKDVAKWFTENEDTVRSLTITLVGAGLLIVEAILGIMLASVRMQNVFTIVATNMAQAFLNLVGFIIDGAEAAFGWVPGIGPKLSQASLSFDAFRGRVDTVFTNLRASGEQTARMFDSAQNSVQSLRTAVEALDGKRATVFLNAQGNMVNANADGSFRVAGSSVSFRAGGGPIVAGRPYIVGENGPELVVPERNGQVYNRSQLSAGGGSAVAASFPDRITLLDADGSILTHAEVIAGHAVASSDRTGRDLAMARGLRSIARGV